MTTPLDSNPAAAPLGGSASAARDPATPPVALDLRDMLVRLRGLQPFQESATLTALATIVSDSSLIRFLDAQSGALSPECADYSQALQELQAGRKRSHWIWYVLPQLRGMGVSEMSFLFGLASREEAKAYLDDSILGARLHESVQAIRRHKGAAIEQIFGHIDATKFRSCLTLFKAVAGPDSIFAAALQEFYQGQEDELTLKLLKAAR